MAATTHPQLPLTNGNAGWRVIYGHHRAFPWMMIDCSGRWINCQGPERPPRAVVSRNSQGQSGVFVVVSKRCFVEATRTIPAGRNCQAQMLGTIKVLRDNRSCGDIYHLAQPEADRETRLDVEWKLPDNVGHGLVLITRRKHT